MGKWVAQLARNDLYNPSHPSGQKKAHSENHFVDVRPGRSQQVPSKQAGQHFRGGRQDATLSLAPRGQAEESIVEMPSTQDLLDHCQMTGSVCEQCLFHSTRPRTMPGTNQNSVSNCSGQSIASSLIMACLHHMNL